MRLVLGAVAISLCACTAEVTTVSLAGTYAMDSDQIADTLMLFADGRYARSFVPANAPPATDTGAWFLSRDGRTVGLRRFPKRRAFGHDYMFDTTGGRVFTEPASLALTIEHSLTRRTLLVWNPLLGWEYRRVK
jgi:hypothetical protein